MIVMGRWKKGFVMKCKPCTNCKLCMLGKHDYIEREYNENPIKCLKGK